MKQASTIDEVITILEEIIQDELNTESNLVLFPILYKKVTEKVKEGILNATFDDTTRMERLDVFFANRYLEAYFLWKANATPTASWKEAFEAAQSSKLILLQHLLLGINAHINLDLGIAVSETMQGDAIDAIQNDYHAINTILENMIDGVQQKIGEVSPLFYLLEKIGKGKEDAIVSFSLEVAREGAWIFANQYHVATDKAAIINQRDASIANLGARLRAPKSRLIRWLLKVIRWLEHKNLSKVASVLNEV